MLEFLKKIMLARELKAPASGTVFPMDQVADDVFSSCMLGGGVAIHPSGGMLVAPADGEVTVMMEESNHAIGLRVYNGFDLLIHIGLDTISMNGQGFTPYVSIGQKVKAGDRLTGFDKALIESKSCCGGTASRGHGTMGPPGLTAVLYRSVSSFLVLHFPLK